MTQMPLSQEQLQAAVQAFEVTVDNAGPWYLMVYGSPIPSGPCRICECAIEPPARHYFSLISDLPAWADAPLHLWCARQKETATRKAGTMPLDLIT